MLDVVYFVPLDAWFVLLSTVSMLRNATKVALLVNAHVFFIPDVTYVCLNLSLLQPLHILLLFI
jgi:hypothetical protein